MPGDALKKQPLCYFTVIISEKYHIMRQDAIRGNLRGSLLGVTSHSGQISSMKLSESTFLQTGATAEPAVLVLHYENKGVSGHDNQTLIF